MCVRALVLLGDGASALCVLDIVVYDCAAVLIVSLCIFFLILCLFTVTTGVDIVDKCWVDCVIDLV